MKASLKRGFTLVELMIVVAIIGILAALAIYGISRYMKSAKSSEATSMVGKMHELQVAVYQGGNAASVRLGLTSSGGTVTNQLCPTGAGVPASAAQVAGVKYQSGTNEWTADAAFNCLGLTIEGPQLFAYRWVNSTNNTGAPGAATNGDILRAVASMYNSASQPEVSVQLRGEVQQDSSTNLVLTKSTAVQVLDNSPAWDALGTPTD